jgi:hypothetical protein
MSKIKARNTALASHLAGRRGAGRHISDERKYAKGRREHLDDSDTAPPDELGDAIAALVAERSGVGLGNSRLSDLVILGSAADVKGQLDALVAAGKLRAFDIFACRVCDASVEAPRSGRMHTCCNKLLSIKTGESFSD